MATSFRVIALPATSFADWFGRTETELQQLGARRITVTESGETPCRVSLVDAEVGETVLLVPFAHHDVNSPYRATGAIFVRPGVPMAEPEVNEIPPMLRKRLLSVRGYDDRGMMRDAEVILGTDVEHVIDRMFGDPQVNYLHVHNARPGCYNCSIIRA